MLVTNLLFSHGFTVIHRSFIRDCVMIFQTIIHLRSIRKKRFYVSESFCSSAKTIQKASTNLTEESQKTPLQEFCKGVFYLIVCAYNLRTLAQSRSA